MTSPRAPFLPALLPLALAGLAPPAAAQQQASPSMPAAMPALPYAAAADLVTQSPLVLDATIRSESRIKGAEAAGVPAGQARFYVEADVARLIRGTAEIPARVGWLVDVPTDARGRAPRLNKRRVLVFARPVSGRPTQIQLVTPGAQIDWTPEAEALVRRIATEANAPDAAPVVTGVRSAFHVPGSLPGEGETQIFLTTRDGRPAALSVLRRPGEETRWSVALSEMIDDGAAAPARDTLLWYRLACALPPELPAAATAAIEPAEAEQARADYRFVIAQLGPCRPG